MFTIVHLNVIPHPSETNKKVKKPLFWVLTTFESYIQMTTSPISTINGKSDTEVKLMLGGLYSVASQGT